MRTHCILLLLCLLSPSLHLSAQSIIEGRIYDTDAVALPGVNLHFSQSQYGGVTDKNGYFQLTKPSKPDTLIISFIGYSDLHITEFPEGLLSLTLYETTEELDEVVLTAFGISRVKKALGYAIEEISSDELSEGNSANPINLINGKVAGLRISQTSGGDESSSRIVLRGNRYLGQDNQALIVVDGVPIDNTTRGSGSTWGGIDYGSGISDINSDDIESISVLKGPNAAALYGSRASNGAIIITTKKATDNKLRLKFQTSISIEQADIRNEFQNTYGAGSMGDFDYKYFNDFDTVYSESGEAYYFSPGDSIAQFNTGYYGKSWGPKMEDQNYLDWDGKIRNYSAQPNNYSDFYQTGFRAKNSISIDKASENSHFRFSYSNTKNNSISPNSNYVKNLLTLRSGSQLNKWIEIDSKVSLSSQETLNRLNQSDGRGAGRHFNLMPRSISLESLESYVDENGQEKIWYTPWPWMSNPYWMAYKNQNKDKKNRLMAYVSGTFILNEDLELQIKTGIDTYHENRYNRIATGSFQNTFGEYSEQRSQFKETNSSFLLLYSKQIHHKLNFNANFGGNTMHQSFDDLYTKNSRLAEPNFYNIENSNLPIDLNSYQSEKSINSFYTSGQFDYLGYLFFDMNLRNDWSSTLPINNNSYLYASYNLSCVFSEAFNLESSRFNFGKIRASWARVGSDSPPYGLQLTYAQEIPFNGTALASVNSTMPNPNLEPMFTNSKELGLDFSLFQNKIDIQTTYYNAITDNQILQSDISDASGFASYLNNVGSVLNKGFEIQANLKLYKSKEISVSSLFTFSKNKNEVLSLSNELDNYILASHWGVTIEAKPGAAYGNIVGVAIQKDETGNRLVDEDGMYIAGDRTVLGNINPDWSGSISPSLSYKSWTLNCLIDFKMGGDIYSATNMYGMGYSGNYIQTLEGREAWYASEAERESLGISSEDWDATGGYLAHGVYANGTEINGEDVSGQQNQNYVNPELYWGQFSEWGNEIHEIHVYDASFIKFRELNISYKFSKAAAERLKVQHLEVAFFARNLALLYSNIPNIDPESSYNNGNGQGIEYGSYPFVKSLGLSLKANF